MYNIEMVVDIQGWIHVQSGKVRELYQSAQNPDVLLMVATDRVSAFDKILTPEIPQKGEILTAVSNIWFDNLGDIVGNHLLNNDEILARIPENIRKRSMLCKKLTMIEVECVVRGYLTGSAYKQYRETGKYLDINLPDGLKDGSKLSEPIFTPAMKAKVGEHDENVEFKTVVETIGQKTADEIKNLSLNIFKKASKLVNQLGYTLVDTKFEFGVDESGNVVLADEVLTPDSSRYLDKDGNSVDKQFVRNYLLKESNWDVDSSDNPPQLPDEIVKKTAELYQKILSDFSKLDIKRH